MKHYYLVDLENVGNGFIEGSESLTLEDTIYIFYSKTHREPASIISDKLNLTGAKIIKIPVYSKQKNAMDFQITTQLGFLIGENGNNADYYIVSGDSGYMSSIEFIKGNIDRNISINMIKNFCSIKSKLETADRIKEILSDFPDKVIRSTKKAVSDSENLNDYHICLQRSLSRDSDRIYKLTKEFVRTLYEQKSNSTCNENQTQKKNKNKQMGRFTKLVNGEIYVFQGENRIEWESITKDEYDAIINRLCFTEGLIEKNEEGRNHIAGRLEEDEKEARSLSKSHDDYFGIKADCMHIAACTVRTLL